MTMLLAAFLLAAPSPEAPAQDVKTVRVLTVGNSFAENACQFLPAIVKADPSVRLVLGKANLGGCTLERHSTLADRSEKDPSAKSYKVVRDGKVELRGLQDWLKAEPWNVVTLQQMSALSYKPESYEPYLGNLVKLVRRLAPTARIHIHQTWAYRPDSSILKREGITQEEMHQRLAAAYASAAKKYDAVLLRSGDAFRRYRRTEGRRVVVPDPAYDYKTPVFPKLPDQTNSLVVGWYWNRRTDPPKLALDFKHANVRGCYLIGAVWYETLFGRDIRENGFRPRGIPEEELAFLKRIAHETVAAAGEPGNGDR